MSNAFSRARVVGGGWRWMVVAWMPLLTFGCSGSSARHPPEREPSLAAQVELVRLGKLDQIQLETTPLADGDLKQIAGLASLRSLLIDDPRSVVSAAGIAALGELPGLVHLRVRGEGIDDAALAAIAHLKGLRILNLPRGKFTSAGLKALAELPHLEQFRFHSPHVDDAGMETLAGMRELKRIHLIGVPITEKGLLALGTMPQLESLYVDDTPLPDSAWTPFFRQREEMGKPVHVHVDEQHHDRDPHAHSHP